MKCRQIFCHPGKTGGIRQKKPEKESEISAVRWNRTKRKRKKKNKRRMRRMRQCRYREKRTRGRDLWNCSEKDRSVWLWESEKYLPEKYRSGTGRRTHPKNR